MIEHKRLVHWLHDLGNRLTGSSDFQHVAQLRGRTTDSTFVLYLDRIFEGLRLGHAYGSAIALAMSLDLSEDVQQRLKAPPGLANVDAILLDAAFELLEHLSDHAQLCEIFTRAGYRYSEHRDHRGGAGPTDIDLYTAETESPQSHRRTGETVNVSFAFTDDGDLNGVRSYSMGDAPANPLHRGARGRHEAFNGHAFEGKTTGEAF